MGYSLHIVRARSGRLRIPITLAEWQAAVADTTGVRIASGDFRVQKSKTGEILRAPNSGGHAEIYVTAGDEWQLVFYWSPTRISFRATEDVDRPDSGISHAARALAARLSAIVVGDESEMYA